MTLGEFTAVIGLCFGVAGFVLGVMNYLRDRYRIDVLLQWDMSVTEGTQYDHTKKWGVIRVTNVGRRPAYVSHVALKLPKGYDHSHLVIAGGITGKTLHEGDPSEIYVVTQEGLDVYAKDWRRIVAQVSDSAGKTWRSKRIPKNAKPSWAGGEA